MNWPPDHECRESPRGRIWVHRQRGVLLLASGLPAVAGAVTLEAEAGVPAPATKPLISASL